MNYDDNNNRWIQYSDKRRRTTSSDSSPFQENTSRSRQSDTQASHIYRASRKDGLPERRTTRPLASYNTDEPRAVYRSCDELQQHIEDGIATRHKLEASRRYHREESSSYDKAQTHRGSYGARSRSYSDGNDTAKQDGLNSRRRNARTSDDSKDESLFHPIDYADFSSISSKRQSSRNRTERNGHMQRTTRYQSSDMGESRRNRNLDTYGQNSRRRNSDTYGKRGSQYRTKHTRGKFGFIAIAVAIIAAVLLCIFALARCTQEATSADGINTGSDTSTALAEEPQAETTDFTPSTSALDSISADEEGIQTFSLSNLDALELDESALAAIEEAVAAIEATSDVGFVFYDLETGRGISLNPDTEVYGASTFKALYALYVCETLVENGQLSLSDSCPVAYIIDSGSWYGTSGASSYPVSELIEAAIVSSDNNAFGFLREAYDDLGFSSWITQIGADDVIAASNTSYFPTYSPRSSAKLWTEMYNYLNTESETAEWLGGLLTQTSTSFIRNALESSDAEDLTVSNKAGWISGSDPDYNAINDAGIIEADGHTYILSIMTSLPDGDINRELFETLAAAIFDARESLNLQES